ncbi:MAG TPA: hypothetical protein VFE17_07505, partial [Candidatus Baltobacteraceae bacterium]|nr:hypothetical protein [Candidatus Baltobacteraceae bacterium]
MLHRIIKAAAYRNGDDQIQTMTAGGFLMGLGMVGPVLGQFGAAFAVAGAIIAAMSLIVAFSLIGLRYWATKTFEYKYGAEPASVDRVPSLMTLSARALPYAHAREHMEKFAEVDRANDEDLAAALVERYPDGLDRHVELIAQKAWL